MTFSNPVPITQETSVNMLWTYFTNVGRQATRDYLQ